MIKINKITAFDQAIAEQLKSQAAEDGLEKGRRGTIATHQQIVGYRRRPENIFASMIKDVWFSKEEMKKPNTRKRKRGPRSLESRKRKELKFNSKS